jgi:hypothetical protein
VVTDHTYWREVEAQGGRGRSGGYFSSSSSGGSHILSLSNVSVSQPIDALRNLLYESKRLRHSQMRKMTKNNTRQSPRPIQPSPLPRLNVPVLMGVNADEGVMFVYTAYPTRMTKQIFLLVLFSLFRISTPAVLKVSLYGVYLYYAYLHYDAYYAYYLFMMHTIHIM